ncbi:MAG: PEP-CTERM sorting domain-containing protein [Planctomycetota bacterium]
MRSRLIWLAIFGCSLLGQARGDVVTFEASDFGLNPTFSNVRTFSFEIDIATRITPGAILDNPTLNGVRYNVFGQLAAGTPSGFSAFDLQRDIGGDEFYAQGSSLSLQIASDADLTDGLQASELTGVDPVFVFNGREVGTGRYHPAIVRLNADGTGSIRNSNNMGGVNPGSGQVVDVEEGEEYITELTFTPGSLTLIDAVSIPEPGMTLALLATSVMIGVRRRRL